MDLTLDIQKDGDISILSAHGEIDDFHAPKLSHTFSQLIEKESCTKLVLDLEGSTFIDSVGLGTIAIAGKKMKQSQGHMGVVCTNAQLLRLINASGIIDALKEQMSLCESIDQAKQKLSTN